MGTTQTPERVIITTIDRDGFDFDTIRSGQGLSMGALGFTTDQWDAMGRLDTDADPAEMAWEKETDLAIDEVLPAIRDLIADALERRLPWSWEAA